MAEFTLVLLLSEVRNIARSHHALIAGKWRKQYLNTNHIPELHGRIIGIIGFGEVGRRLVKLMAGFEMKSILVYDPYVSDDEPLLPNDPLLELDNLTMTAHLAGTTMDALPRSARILARDILRLADGERAQNAPVRDLVNPVNWRKTFGL